MSFRAHPVVQREQKLAFPLAAATLHQNTNPEGEFGILKDVILSHIEPWDMCFLIIEHRGAEYIGVLLVSDTAFLPRDFRGTTSKPG
jgi:hypothetical protein